MSRKKPCIAVAEEVRAGVEQELTADSNSVTPFKRAVWRARDMLRNAGITGIAALNHILAIIALREFELLFPSVVDLTVENFNENRGPIVADIDMTTEVTICNRRHSFSLIANTPFNTNTTPMHCDYVRGAFEALYYATDTNGENVLTDPIAHRYCELFTLKTAHRMAYDLICHIRDNMAFEDDNGEVFGKAYESVIVDFLDGKELGQFLTPKPVVDYATRAAKEGRELGDMLDPTCGSGRFLAGALRNGAKSVSGVEIDENVHPISYTYLFILGHKLFGLNDSLKTPSGIRLGDFLRDKWNTIGRPEKYDTILANPPYGVKNVDYVTDLIGVEHLDPNTHEITNDTSRLGPSVYPFKSTATNYFLQRIIHSLKIGGRASVVLPLGRELASRSPADVKFRRAIMKAISVREVVTVASGTFENTSIRTVVVVFDKVRELNDCIEITGKKKKVTKLRDNIESATAAFKILRLKTDASGIVLGEAEPIPGKLEAVTSEKLEEMGWSLSPVDYDAQSDQCIQNDDIKNSSRDSKILLGELCQFTTGKYNSKDKTTDGKYEFYTATINNPTGRSDLDPFRFNSPYILFAKQGGNCNDMTTDVGLAKAWYLTIPACATTPMVALHDFNPDQVVEKYIYHWLNCNSVQIRTKYARFLTGLGSITLERLRSIPIQLPPLETQRKIADELDALEEQAKLYDAAAEKLEESMRMTLEDAIYARGYLGRKIYNDTTLAEGVEMKQISEICEIETGEYITKSEVCSVGYPVYGGGGIAFITGKHNRENKVVIAKDGVSEKCVRYVADKFFLNHHGWTLKITNNIVDEKYLNFVLQLCMQSSIYDMARGMAQKGINMDRFYNLHVPILPIDKQNIAVSLIEMDRSLHIVKAMSKQIRYSMHKFMSN